MRPTTIRRSLGLVGACLALLAVSCTERNAIILDSGLAHDGAARDHTMTRDSGPSEAGPIACQRNTDCSSESFYCHFDSGCGFEGSGVCLPRPEGCLADCPGVCGCDGQTFCNSCEAHAAGVNVSSSGACPAPPLPACGSTAECSPVQYCHLDGACPSPAGGAKGTCMPRPTICPDYYTCPWACGCDGQSYCSDCEAQQAGVNVKHLGPCMTCDEIDKAYRAEVKAAKKCCAFCAAIQCTNQVKDELACPCPTYINAQPSPEMKALEQQWYLQSCTVPCPEMLCPVPAGAACVHTGGSGANNGTCQDFGAK